MAFRANKKFKREYEKLFKQDPVQANLFLLLCEVADRKGQVYLPADKNKREQALAELMTARFNDPEEYAL